MAESLAHHYSQTDKVDKAFTYLSMSGSKSLSVYSLEEAANHFDAALALLDKNPDCASDDQFAEFLDGVTGRPRRKPLAYHNASEGALCSRLLARRW